MPPASSDRCWVGADWRDRPICCPASSAFSLRVNSAKNSRSASVRATPANRWRVVMAPSGRRTGDGYPDCLSDEFPGCPIERPGRLYELSRNGKSHLRMPLRPGFYPSRNAALVGVVKLRLVECGCDDLLLWI